jgi:hypothetical protein
MHILSLCYYLLPLFCYLDREGGINTTCMLGGMGIAATWMFFTLTHKIKLDP